MLRFFWLIKQIELIRFAGKKLNLNSYRWKSIVNWLDRNHSREIAVRTIGSNHIHN